MRLRRCQQQSCSAAWRKKRGQVPHHEALPSFKSTAADCCERGTPSLGRGLHGLGAALLKQGRTLRSRKYERIVILDDSLRYALVARLAGVHEIYAYGAELRLRFCKSAGRDRIRPYGQTAKTAPDRICATYA